MAHPLEPTRQWRRVYTIELWEWRRQAAKCCKVALPRGMLSNTVLCRGATDLMRRWPDWNRTFG